MRETLDRITTWARAHQGALLRYFVAVLAGLLIGAWLAS